MKLQALITKAQGSIASSLGLALNEAKLEAQILLQHLLKVNRAWLISHESDALEANIHVEFEALLKRRLDGEPIAHILGKREFYGLELSVTPDTLIPRPDTETLVEAALAKIPNPSFPRRRESSEEEKMDSRLRGNDDGTVSNSISVLDLGTGTGAIALAIASQRPDVEVVAVDASTAALNVAKLNAEKLAITNIRFLQSNWFSALGDATFDIIVSNPPYIAQDDPHLSQGDLRFEPISALASGPDGLDDIRRIILHAPAHLKLQGWLMFEHGYDQAEKVAQLLRNTGFDSVTSVADLSGILRVTMGKKNQ
jgi:release factor glutamine methyltransferase